MDDITKAVSNAFAKTLAANAPDLQTAILNCLKTRCNSAIGKCRAKDGPCPEKRISLESRRACRPLKRVIMGMEANENICSDKARRLFAKIPEEKIGDPAVALAE